MDRFLNNKDLVNDSTPVANNEGEASALGLVSYQLYVTDAGDVRYKLPTGIAGKSPTNGIVDDVNKSFTFTPSDGKPLVAFEFRLRPVGGVWIAPIKCSPTNTVENNDGSFSIINIPDINISAGDFQVRMKAIGDNLPSPWLSSQGAYYISFDDVTGVVKTPDSLPGLKAWWDFSDQTTLDLTGSSINSITDKSASGNDLVSIAGKEPELVSSGSNGHSFAKFLSGMSDLRKKVALQGPFSFYIMFKTDGDLVEGNTLIDFRSDAPQYPEYLAGIRKGASLVGISGIQAAEASFGFEQFDNQRWALFVISYDNRYASIFLNKEFEPRRYFLDQLQYPWPVGDYLDEFWIKMGKSADFSMHEMIIAEGQLSTDDDRDIRNYFMNKYSPSTREKMVQAYGDSITVGFGSSGGQNGYIQRLCAQKGFFLKNNGKSGSSILHHNDNIGLLDIYQEDKFDKDHIVTFNHGTNINPGAGVATSIEGYRTVINYFLSMGYKKERLIIISPAYRTVADDLWIFVEGISALADELGVGYIDLWEHMKATYNETELAGFLADGLHPNDDGHQMIANYCSSKMVGL